MFYFNKIIPTIFTWGIMFTFFAAELITENGELVLKNQKVAFTFDRTNLTLKQIRDLQRKADFITAPGSSLFTVALWNPSDPGPAILNHPKFSTNFDMAMAIDGSSAQKRTYSVAKDAAGRTVLSLHYLDNTFAGFSGVMNVTVTIALGDKDGVAEWRIRTDNRTKYQLYEIRFPRIGGIASALSGSDKTDHLLLPVDSGEKLMHPRVNAGLKYFYPNCMSMQMTGYCDGQGGILYYAAHDPGFYRKEYVAERAKDNKSFLTEFRYAADCPGLEKWEIPYPTMIGVIDGDWYDLAKYYRKNFANKTWKTFAERDDIAPWFRDLGVWVHGGAAHWENRIVSTPEKMEEFVARMLKIREILDEDIALHWYVWHKHVTFDQYYPDYLPARADFPAAVTRLEAAGIHCMPYVNSHYFDRNLPEWGDGIRVRESVVTDIVPDRFDLKVYNMVTMCHATEFWRTRLTDIERGILGLYPVSALYLDELSSIPELCYATNHEHKSHGGNFYAGGQHKIIDIIRKAKEWGERKPVITGEGLTETHINYIDGSISAHCDMNPHADPMFQAVHSDRIAVIGQRMNMDDVKDMDRFMAKIAFSLVRGKQLGWFETFMVFDSYDLTSPEARPAMEKLKECTALRRAGQEFLFYGELLRPPALNVPSSKIIWSREAAFIPEPNLPVVEIPEVFAQCFRSPQGNFGIILANRTNREISVNIPWNSKDWPFLSSQMLTRMDFCKGKWSTATRITPGKVFKVTLPPYTPMLVKFSR